MEAVGSDWSLTHTIWHNFTPSGPNTLNLHPAQFSAEEEISVFACPIGKQDIILNEVCNRGV